MMTDLQMWFWQMPAHVAPGFAPGFAPAHDFEFCQACCGEDAREAAIMAAESAAWSDAAIGIGTVAP